MSCQMPRWVTAQTMRTFAAYSCVCSETLKVTQKVFSWLHLGGWTLHRLHTSVLMRRALYSTRSAVLQIRMDTDWRREREREKVCGNDIILHKIFFFLFVYSLHLFWENFFFSLLDGNMNSWINRRRVHVTVRTHGSSEDETEIY